MSRVLEPAEEIGDESNGRRTGDRRRENPYGTSLLPNAPERFANLTIDLSPRAALAASGRVGQTMTVVEPKNRRRTNGAGRATRERGMLIPIDLVLPAMPG